MSEEQVEALDEQDDSSSVANKSVPKTAPARPNSMSAANFFFRAKPKQVLSSVKRALAGETETEAGAESIKATVAIAKAEAEITKGLADMAKGSSETMNDSCGTLDDEAMVRLPVAKRRNYIEIISSESDLEGDGQTITKCSKGAPNAIALLTRPEKGEKSREISLKPSRKTAASDSMVRPSIGLTEEEIDPWLLESLRRKAATQQSQVDDMMIKVVLFDEFPYHVGDVSSHRHEYVIASNANIAKLYQTHCKAKRLNHYSVVLTHRGVRLFGSAVTPKSLGVYSGSFTIKAYQKGEYEKMEEERKRSKAALLETLTTTTTTSDSLEVEGTDGTGSTTADLTEPSGVSLMTLRFKTGARREPVILTTSSTSSMQLLIPELLSELGLPPSSPFGLIFDGSLIDLSRTPAQLGLEEEDLLEVRC